MVKPVKKKYRSKQANMYNEFGLGRPYRNGKPTEGFKAWMSGVRSARRKLRAERKNEKGSKNGR